MANRSLNTERREAFWRHRMSSEGKWFCEWCQRQVFRDVHEIAVNRATIDHIVAKALGGDNKQENLVVSCRDCNIEKSKREYVLVKKLNLILGVGA